MIANESLAPSAAAELIAGGAADAVSWGKYYISNPDLAERIKNGFELSPYDSNTFYSEGPRGYVDYPAAKKYEEAVR